MEATPLGNGRLGAMIFGGIKNRKIALNEITLWSGQPDPHQEIACGKEKTSRNTPVIFSKENGSKVIKWPADTWQAIPIRSGLTCP